MNQERTSIGPWLFWSLSTITCFGFGYINANIYNAETMGANGYLAVPLAALCSIPGLIAIYLLMKRFPNHNIIQQSIVILGGFLGRLVSIIYLLFLLVFFIVYSTDVAILIHNYLLESTPFYIICAADLLIAAYLGSRGIETVSRIASFVILPLATVVFLLFILILPEVRVDRLLPIFNFQFNFEGVGGTSILNIFYPMGLWAFITPYCKNIQQKIPRMTMLAFSVLISFFLLDNIGTIGIYGHTYISQLPYPSI
ncbi:MAG TPA: GerAB/ArcD/ProY family transporter, partial [Bacillota bacterium]|nr:GerAB/ArcD/ProY family transporter [Bacillota bacterium]